MTTTRGFQNGNSQALRIPQEMKTDKKDFCINKIGDIFVAFSADFMKNTYPALTERLLSCDPVNLLILSITVSELEHGASQPKAYQGGLP